MSRILVDVGSLPVLPGSRLLPGAHHPHCPRHEHHLLWIAGRPLCLGCSSMAAGASLGLLAVASLPLVRMTPLAWLAAHLAMITPTAIQPFVQRKRFKVFARALLGAGTVTWLVGRHVGRTPGWLSLVEVAASALVAVVLAKALLWLREAKTPNPCASCPLGTYPTCEWNLPRILEESSDAGLVEALVGGRAPLAKPEAGFPAESAASVEGTPHTMRQAPSCFATAACGEAEG